MTADYERTISQLAQDVGVSVETIRYYERTGLIRQPRTPKRGWRKYGHETFRRLKFIKRSQRLGFTLDEIKELLSMRASSNAKTCARVTERASAKLTEIDEKIRDLQAMREVLTRLSASCTGQGSGPACPLLYALADD